jgi:hypothetical protein
VRGAPLLFAVSRCLFSAIARSRRFLRPSNRRERALADPSRQSVCFGGACPRWNTIHADKLVKGDRFATSAPCLIVFPSDPAGLGAVGLSATQAGGGRGRVV